MSEPIHDFSFVIPGQPPSVNRMYGNTWNFDGERSWTGRRKVDEAVAYQLVAMNACQRAKPALWEPREAYLPREGRGLIVIEFRYYLARDMDCDNTKKAILDAIKYGLGTFPFTDRKKRTTVRPMYDDNRFLSRDLSKQTGFKEPRVEVTIRG